MTRFASAPLSAAALLLSVLTLLAVTGEPASAQTYLTSLNGYQEVPSVSTTGTGVAVVIIPDETQIGFKLSYGNLTGTVMMAHIHFGQRGTNGGVVAFLCGGGGKPACPASGDVQGAIVAADVQAVASQGIAAGELTKVIGAIRSGAAYINVHTDKFPSGEIRGQLVPRPTPPAAQ